MTAAPGRSFHSFDALPRMQGGTGGVQKSQSKVLVQSFGAEPSVRDLAGGAVHGRARQLAGLQPGPVAGVLPLAAEGFRDWFLPTFATWLQANFDDPVHVGRAFRVQHQTAVNWWNGDNRASGDMVAICFMTFPAALAWFLAEWEGRG